MQFDADRSGQLALGLEEGHSRRRIVHAGGAATGRRITRELSALAATHERIRVFEPLAATSLVTHEGRCTGLVVRARDGAPLPIRAGAVVLATGGMAALWGGPPTPGALSAPASRLPTRRARSSRTSSSCSFIPPRCARAARATASS